MSIGDVKGARRRQKIRQINGHAPKPKGRSIHASIEAEKRKALRMAAASGQKKK